MNRRDFINSIIGDHHVLWYDRDEIISIICQAFAFADNLTRRDTELMLKMRGMQRSGRVTPERDEMERRVDEILTKRMKYYEYGNRKKGESKNHP